MEIDAAVAAGAADASSPRHMPTAPSTPATLRLIAYKDATSGRTFPLADIFLECPQPLPASGTPGGAAVVSLGGP
jgi:hypothetical protein